MLLQSALVKTNFTVDSSLTNFVEIETKNDGQVAGRELPIGIHL
jgi:hypothetical protein